MTNNQIPELMNNLKTDLIIGYWNLDILNFGEIE